MHLCSMHSISWAGSVGGRALRGRGVLLEHRAAASAIEEAREQARVRVQIRHVRDWVVDYSEPGAVWVISDWAWYRWANWMPGLHKMWRPFLCMSLNFCPKDMSMLRLNQYPTCCPKMHVTSLASSLGCLSLPLCEAVNMM